MKWFNLTYDDYRDIQNQSKLAMHVSPVIARDDIRAVSDYTSTNGEVSVFLRSTARCETSPYKSDAGSTTKITISAAVCASWAGK